MNEERCVLQSIQGNEDAFNLLVTRYGSPIRNFIYRLVGDFHHSQDLAQETFLKAFRSLPRLESPSNFRSWLFKIAFHVSIDWRRGNGEKTVSLDLLAEKGTEDRGERAALERERKDDALIAVSLVVLALHSIPKEYSLLLYLFYFKGIQYRDLARMMDITRANVKIRLFRARKMLRNRLQENPLFLRCCENLSLNAC